MSGFYGVQGLLQCSKHSIFLLINSIYYLSKRSGHGVMASAFHQKRQVADLLGINLFKKKKKKKKKKKISGKAGYQYVSQAP